MAATLGAVLPRDGYLIDSGGAFVYQSDGFTLARGTPAAVAFPRSTAEASALLRALAAQRVPIVTRGSGTGLAGGAAPMGEGVVLISTSRMTRVISVDISGRCANVEAGVLNGALNDVVAAMPGGEVLHFAPDPSSARASTIGGNVATNAGGVHTLKDFVTSNHVLGATMVLASGEVITTGGRGGTQEQGPFDLTALICGSEGTLGVITELWVRLTPKRPAFRTLSAMFAAPRDACDVVSDIISAGILPAAMEMMDGTMLGLIEDAYHFGIPRDAAAMLLIELDGEESLLDAESKVCEEMCWRRGATSVHPTRDPAERAKLWKARKGVFGAIGRISHSYCTQDACVPRSRLGEVLDGILAVGREYGLTITSAFHAGDGNVHPVFIYDDRKPEEVTRAMTACAEVLQMCIDAGGTITGEHGVGVEKVGMMPRLFDRATMGAFEGVRRAFDPNERMNPGKLLPSEANDFAIIR